MENTIIKIDPIVTLYPDEIESNESRTFITANTVPGNFDDIRNNHIIPVFTKDNEPVISHHDFIKVTREVVSETYSREHILKPSIRLSHPIMGRIPEAKDKAAADLAEYEKTIYYERMMFLLEIPSIRENIDGNTLSLTIGGVKAYNMDNLYNCKGVDQHFKVFIGFKNTVCTNMCVWSDGYVGDLKVTNLATLKAAISSLVQNYNAQKHLTRLKQLPKYHLSEQQFAQLIGRCRMYQHLPTALKQEIPQLLFGDNQISTICKDFYKDHSFCRNDSGELNLWRLFNLFTGANKSSYIDGFLDRSVNAYHFVEKLQDALEHKINNWYLN